MRERPSASRIRGRRRRILRTMTRGVVRVELLDNLDRNHYLRTGGRSISQYSPSAYRTSVMVLEAQRDSDEGMQGETGAVTCQCK